MAETPMPSLERSASHIDHQPVSGLAVAALIVSSFSLIYAVTTLFRPVMGFECLFPPFTGIVLAILGRAHIYRSERARCGLKLANVALSLSIVSAAVIGGRLAANYFVFRKDSEKVGMDWFNLLKENKIAGAYYKMIDPIRSQAIAPDDEKEIEANFGPPLVILRNSELIRIFQRNGADVQVESLGIGNFDQASGDTYRVTNRFRVSSPEGTCELNLVMLGVENENTVGRQWFIKNFEDFSIKTKTTYGVLVLELGREAEAFTRTWLEQMLQKDTQRVYLDTLSEADRSAAQAIVNASQAAGGALVSRLPSGSALIPPDRRGKVDLNDKDAIYKDLLARNFFQVQGFETEEKKKTLKELWKIGAMFPTGMTRGANPDSQPLLSVTPQGVEFAITIEMQLTKDPPSLTKGRMVIASNSPGLTNELIDLRKQGMEHADKSDLTKVELLGSRPPRHWRVVRIETDLEKFTPPQMPTQKMGAGGR